MTVLYSGITLNVARPDMNNYAALRVMLYEGIGGPKDFALWDLARRATLGCMLLRVCYIRVISL